MLDVKVMKTNQQLSSEATDFLSKWKHVFKYNVP